MSPDEVGSIDEWIERAAAVLGVSTDLVDRVLLLDLARDAAHGIARPAAPITTFLLGLAVGREGADTSRMAELAGLLGEELAS